MTINYKKRIARVYKELKKAGRPTALLLGSASNRLRSLDQFHTFRQDSNFFYLTGSQGHGFCILLSTESKNPLLFAPPVNPLQIVWEGEGESASELAKSLGCDLIQSEKLLPEIKRRLLGVELLYFQNQHENLAWKISKELIELDTAQRGRYPASFINVDEIFTTLRLYKDADEIKFIRQAIALTHTALQSVLPHITNGGSEQEIAAHIEYIFNLHGARPSFSTIAAAGASGATLHYHALNQNLRARDLFLLDFGAELNMYAADITRTLPISGKFNPMQAEVYQAVLNAQKAAIRKIKHGVKIIKVYQAAAEALTVGLQDLGILKGKLSKLMEKKAYLPYFPHGIGHSLGIDVHDIGKLRGNNSAVLENGMVFTVEPGLYFSRKTGKVPAMGIRIEDDILVTAKGCENLSKAIPKEIAEIEEWMGR